MDDNEEYDNKEDQDQNEEAEGSPEKHSEGQKEYLEVNGQLKGKKKDKKEKAEGDKIQESPYKSKWRKHIYLCI